MRHRVEFGEMAFLTLTRAREWVRNYMDGHADNTLVPRDVMKAWMRALIRNHPDADVILSGAWTGEVVVRNFGGRKAATARLVMAREFAGKTETYQVDISLAKCLKGSIVTLTEEDFSEPF